jgi:hypothetical protein
MALERFIPKSPDMFIRNSQDFEVAKFGHLNTIVEYINNNSAKPAGLNGYVQFNDNAALGGDAGLFWDNVNKRLGVGTVTPGAVLEIYGGTETLGISGPANQAKSIQIARYNNSSFQSHYIGDDGGAFFGAGLTISSSGANSQIYLQVSAPGRNVNIGSAGQTLLPTDLGARLGVRGSGSTSATTALLVQNSAGTTLLQTLDNATTTLAGKTFTGTGTILVPAQAHSASDIVMKGDSALISANGNANQWAKIVLSDVGANTTYQNSAGSHTFKIGTTSPTTYLSIAPNNITTGGSTRITMGAQDASDIYQGTGANVYGSFLPFGGSGYTVFKNSYTLGSYRFFTAPAVNGTLVEALRITNTGNVGIGTTAPVGILHLYKSAAATRLAIDGDAGQNRLISYRTGAVQRFGLYVNNTAESGSNAGSNFAIRAYNDAGTLLSTPFFINRATGNIGVNTLTGTAKLQVVGSGSTSATTSLLVQNSAGQQLMSVLDDGSCTIGVNGATTNPLTIVGNSGIQAIIGNTFFQSPQGIFRYGGGLLNFYGGNNDGIGFNFTFLNQQLSSSVNSVMVNLGGNYTNQTQFQLANLRIAPIYDFNVNTLNTAIARGIYYNPTITNLRVANHYAWQNTSGAMIVNSSTPQASAVLQADSTTQGFLPPRMTNAQRVAIVTPAVGLMVYCTDAVEGLYVYKSTGWTFVA